VRVKCDSRQQAELLVGLVKLGLRGFISLPASAEDCTNCSLRLNERIAQARAAFEALAERRGGNDKTRAEVVELAMHWFIHGRDHKDRKEVQAVVSESPARITRQG